MILPQSTYIKNHIIHDVIVHNCIHKCRSLSACFVMAAAKLGPGLSQVLRLTNSNSQDTERERELQSSTLSSSLLDSQILFLKKTEREERRDRAVVVWRPNKFSPRNSLQLQSAVDTSKCLAAGEEENSFPIAHTWVQWVGEVKSFSIAHGWGVW